MHSKWWTSEGGQAMGRHLGSAAPESGNIPPQFLHFQLDSPGVDTRLLPFCSTFHSLLLYFYSIQLRFVRSGSARRKRRKRRRRFVFEFWILCLHRWILYQKWWFCITTDESSWAGRPDWREVGHVSSSKTRNSNPKHYCSQQNICNIFCAKFSISDAIFNICDAKLIIFNAKSIICTT